MELSPDPRRSTAAVRTPAEELAWLAAVVLALSAFMSWYTGSADGITLSVTGWHTGALGKLVFFLGLAVVIVLALRPFGIALPPTVPVGMIVLGLGAVATIVVLFRLISVPQDFVGLGRSIGLWISLLAALLVSVAGFLRGAEDV
jgi:hypothetical protein